MVTSYLGPVEPPSFIVPLARYKYLAEVGEKGSMGYTGIDPSIKDLFGPLEPLEQPRSSPCVLCKGSKNLCGKDKCALMVKYYARSRTVRMLDSVDLAGSSPPGVFIGRYGYPKVEVGPLVPPEFGDTSPMDTPETWVGKSIEEIVDFRFRLVRGKFQVGVKDFQNAGRMMDYTRDLGLCVNSVDVEANFAKRPSGKIVLDDEIQPFGPSAKLNSFDITNPKYDHKVEKAFYDTDLKAVEAVGNLYKEGVLISRIQKAFSVGAFGIERNRRLVPTRWSITAVDDTLGKQLLKVTKTYPTIDDWRVYDWDQLDNRWSVLLMPTSWRYELIEAWYPNTAWNPLGKQIEVISSHELFNGRKEYAEIGGCYYAARLAVNELLMKERRQAGAVIFREAHPGYIMPVGVWNVRENVRRALAQKCSRFPSLNEALTHVSKRMDIPIRRWISTSEVLKDYLRQRRIDDYT